MEGPNLWNGALFPIEDFRRLVGFHPVTRLVEVIIMKESELNMTRFPRVIHLGFRL